MGRGVSSGGGQSSLGYLFGGGEAPAPRPARNNSEALKSGPTVNNDASKKSAAGSTTASAGGIVGINIPAGFQGNTGNNYFRADGQNCGNFITDRPSTKVHAAPGGGSSLGYLFGGNN